MDKLDTLFLTPEEEKLLDSSLKEIQSLRNNIQEKEKAIKDLILKRKKFEEYIERRFNIIEKRLDRLSTKNVISSDKPNSPQMSPPDIDPIPQQMKKEWDKDYDAKDKLNAQEGKQ